MLEKENVEPNAHSESELDHMAEVLVAPIAAEISLDDLIDTGISLDDLMAAAEFETYSGWS